MMASKMAAIIHGNNLNKTVLTFVVKEVLGDITMHINVLTSFLNFEKRGPTRQDVFMVKI